MANIENFSHQTNLSQNSDDSKKDARWRTTKNQKESSDKYNSNRNIDILGKLSLDELWQACDANSVQLMNLISEFIGRRTGHVEHSFKEFEAYSCASNAVQSYLYENRQSDKIFGLRKSDASNGEKISFDLSQSEKYSNSILSEFSLINNSNLLARKISRSESLIKNSEASKQCENNDAQISKMNKLNDFTVQTNNSKSDDSKNQEFIDSASKNANKLISPTSNDNEMKSSCMQTKTFTDQTIEARLDNQSEGNNNTNKNSILNNGNLKKIQSNFKRNFNLTTKSNNQEDCYNGSIIYNQKTNKILYSWSQSLDELDITIPVSIEINNKSQCKVIIQCNYLKVMLKKQHSDLMIVKLDGRLAYSIRPKTSYWTMEPGRCLRLFLEKEQARWWNRFLDCEIELNLDEIEKTIKYDQLSLDEQNIVQQLTYQQIDKLRQQKIVQ